jgi:hypothetical protein
MQQVITETSWPKHLVKSIECRKRDLVIRIADFTRDKEEPAYDVEVYINGVYDWNKSETICTKSSGRSKKQARILAIEFACLAIKNELK